ncbi:MULTISPECIES: aldo/keto reductase [Chryseobacterium]|uniref:2,5-diketo-D-gluconate reductase A n=1 Tax=Chryseobacterium camelliae TaxID=1265445 RepID=A0ABU0TJM9_9FLAO|nr:MULTISPECIES: aldo/keto reductase [Chryseobacterium]MDT3408899.1 2,5-diketo-D-gluconate reductase A [Pseudacidovorax intermedius]MDQ1097244.1 2,5-diketo-D-gluconate reductase A [Chryseobacterium camelliae]MDQ1101179.1 2,5-diketo-D-gluconate reductase A [Chryseobacterium sp. SORGH_AS_1048]MDR6084624.1 2,5-diketo-D-gluconate reductase A [Chryseobacterium sp. SORGH_AS_0909]MDR6132896.1 2,5-diketo-D-gluconate reductase A [Chryseobacterium sp. SORGH_AS_1175]
MHKKTYAGQPVITLNNGVDIPALGFGVWQIDDLKQCENAVVKAIETGYRMIDTAAIYQNETAVGNAVKNSGIDREQLFITSKLWVQDTSYEKAKSAFQQTLDRLQLDYLDMYLIHWPYADFKGAWKAMEELYDEGKIKAIGVCNFTVEKLEELKTTAKVSPVINQIELHPVFQQKELQVYNRENNIITQPWSPLGNGNSELLNNSSLKSIAEKHHKTVAQVILRWHLQEGFCVIPKSVTPSRIEENFNVFDFELSEDEMNTVRSRDTGKRLFFDPKDPEWEKKMLNAVADI